MGSNGLILPGRSVRDVWVEYRKVESRTKELRNRLIEFYFPLVRYHAERMHARLPDEVELDDLMSVGVFGLIDAIDSFDLSRGVKFETYCAPRIRGAILDELRAMDWIPRLTRSRHRKLETARNALRLKLGRDPTHEEVREALGVSEEAYEDLIGDSNAVQVSSHSRKWFEAKSEVGKGISVADTIADDSTEDPAAGARSRDLREAITRGMDGTSKLVVVLHEFEGYSMKEVGLFLLLSESRVSQLHTAAMARIKASPSLRDLYYNKAG